MIGVSGAANSDTRDKLALMIMRVVVMGINIW